MLAWPSWSAGAAQAPALEQWTRVTRLLLWAAQAFSPHISKEGWWLLQREQLCRLRSQLSSDVGPWRPSWIIFGPSQTRSRSRLSSQPDGRPSLSVETSSLWPPARYCTTALIHFVNDVLGKVDIFGQKTKGIQKKERKMMKIQWSNCSFLNSADRIADSLITTFMMRSSNSL